MGEWRSAAFLGLMLGISLASFANDAVSFEAGGRPEVRERLDGMIVAGGEVFASWREYAASDGFREAGRRCGLRRSETPTSTIYLPESLAAGASSPADCSFNLTNPDAIYDPTVAHYRIPVVVHVIRNSVGSGDISEATVRGQIDLLNRDFLAMLGSLGQAGVNIEIEFFLAETDPGGNPTTGITFSTNDTWFNDGGDYWDSLAWDTARYLNIYTNAAGGDLGYVPDLPQANLAGNNVDRVVILWSSFGANAPIGPPYNLGRTTTHEVGHWLGLDHTFAGGCASASACATNGDLICDTNPQADPTSGCSDAASCGSSDPIHNYMDYSDDICMTGFTPIQARRMRCSLENYRPDVFSVDSGTCGDGNVEFGEECDDGNTVNGDGCDENCRYERTCGNGVLEPGEPCDDGNLMPGDGCDASCVLEPVCGNGVFEPGEACDDGNTAGGDGCDSFCALEEMGDCCDSVHGVGCSVSSVETCVCGQDDYCCNIGWDPQCVEQVETFGCGACSVAAPPAEVSSPSATESVTFPGPETLNWQDASAIGVQSFNVYRGVLTELAQGSSGSCFRSGLGVNSTSDAAFPAAGSGWFYLITGVIDSGEGSLGSRSSGVPRFNSSPCP